MSLKTDIIWNNWKRNLSWNMFAIGHRWYTVCVKARLACCYWWVIILVGYLGLVCPIMRTISMTMASLSGLLEDNVTNRSLKLTEIGRSYMTALGFESSACFAEDLQQFAAVQTCYQHVWNTNYTAATSYQVLLDVAHDNECHGNYLVIVSYLWR